VPRHADDFGPRAQGIAADADGVFVVTDQERVVRIDLAAMRRTAVWQAWPGCSRSPSVRRRPVFVFPPSGAGRREDGYRIRVA
jgi:hypothetical protein